MTIGADARLFASLLGEGERTEHELDAKSSGWLHVARGRVLLNGQELGPGDGAGMREERSITIEGLDEAELVLWEFPA